MEGEVPSWAVTPRPWQPHTPLSAEQPAGTTQLRQVDQRPPRHREGVWLDQTVGRAAAVTETARRRKSKCGVRPARDRLQPDPIGQPGQASDGRGMNRWLRGVARRL